MLWEVWDAREHLERHLRSEDYRLVLAAIDLSQERSGDTLRRCGDSGRAGDRGSGADARLRDSVSGKKSIEKGERRMTMKAKKEIRLIVESATVAIFLGLLVCSTAPI